MYEPQMNQMMGYNQWCMYTDHIVEVKGWLHVQALLDCGLLDFFMQLYLSCKLNYWSIRAWLPVGELVTIHQDAQVWPQDRDLFCGIRQVCHGKPEDVLPLCLRVHWWCVKALLGAFPCLSQVFHPTKIKQDSSNVWERSIALIILICRYLQIFANMLSKLSMLSILSMLSSSNFPFCRNVAVFTSFYPLKSLGSSMACSVHCSASFSIHKIHKSWGTCFSRADRCWGQGWGGVVEDARWTLEEVGRNGPVSSQGRQGQDFLQHPSVFHETNIRREPHNIKIIKIFVHFKAWIMSCICIWKLCISLFYFGHTKLTKHADICSIETSPAISVAGGLAVPCEWRARELHRALFDRGLGGPWGTWRMFVDDLGWFLLSKRFGFNMWRHCEDHLVDICRSYSILIMYNLRHQDAIWCNKF